MKSVIFKSVMFAVLLSATFAVAQDSGSAPAQDNSKHGKNWVTVQGCVSRANGDYILMKQDPAVTYELHRTGKIRLHDYLGQRVEVSGDSSPSLSTSSDAGKTNASPITITVSTIKTLDKECPAGAQ
jgi:hypothetical protein